MIKSESEKTRDEWPQRAQRAQKKEGFFLVNFVLFCGKKVLAASLVAAGAKLCGFASFALFRGHSDLFHPAESSESLERNQQARSNPVQVSPIGQVSPTGSGERIPHNSVAHW